MSFITRGFSGRGRERDDRLPPGQTLVEDWPVLSAGVTPQIDPEDWSFEIKDETGTEHRWNWDQMQALQDSRDNNVAIASVRGTASASFTCVRAIRDIKADMKEVTLTASWRGYDGRPHSARFITRYGKSGLYDYFYTAH